jgi:hypothetical protein
MIQSILHIDVIKYINICVHRRVQRFFAEGAALTIIILTHSIRLSEYSLTGLSLNEYTQGSYVKK